MIKGVIEGGGGNDVRGNRGEVNDVRGNDTNPLKSAMTSSTLEGLQTSATFAIDISNKGFTYFSPIAFKSHNSIFSISFKTSL